MVQTQLSIADALQLGLQKLTKSDSPRLDSEILLLKVLNDSSEKHFTKTWLLTWPEKTLNSTQKKQFNHYLNLRSKGIPIAYITHRKDFWTLTLEVTPATLIPRPETELLVECALEKLPLTQSNILDIGTGSGAIALAIASEQTQASILATDISQEALEVARRNAQRLSITNVNFFLSHWFENIPEQKFDIIVSNPPYIAPQDPLLEENVRKHEPLMALLSEGEGLNDIKTIIKESKQYLKTDGWLLLEHGFTQKLAVQDLFKQYAFTQISTHNDLNHLPRVTQGKLT